MGTALNKILKDIIVKFHQMDGKDSIYVPGWDCHGLPIEWKIEEQYKKNKKNKNEVPIVEFRKECRSFAEKWIEVHKGQFKRLGVIGDWENYYSTMSYDAEAQIVRELGKFLKEGSLYRGLNLFYGLQLKKLHLLMQKLNIRIINQILFIHLSCKII
jgi:isoleucyl-tRNA synthetase